MELEILKVIWQRGQATVREVYRDLAQSRKIAYTTVLTMMGILEQKGHVIKSPGERANLYTAAQRRERVVQTMVSEFVGRVFGGSAKPLLAHLLGDASLRPDELQELEALLKQRRKRSTNAESEAREDGKRNPGRRKV